MAAGGAGVRRGAEERWTAVCRGICGCVGNPGPAPRAGEWWGCAHGGDLWGSDASADSDHGVGWPHPDFDHGVEGARQWPVPVGVGLWFPCLAGAWLDCGHFSMKPALAGQAFCQQH